MHFQFCTCLSIGAHSKCCKTCDGFHICPLWRSNAHRKNRSALSPGISTGIGLVRLLQPRLHMLVWLFFFFSHPSDLIVTNCIVVFGCSPTDYYFLFALINLLASIILIRYKVQDFVRLSACECTSRYASDKNVHCFFASSL